MSSLHPSSTHLPTPPPATQNTNPPPTPSTSQVIIPSFRTPESSTPQVASSKGKRSEGSFREVWKLWSSKGQNNQPGREIGQYSKKLRYAGNSKGKEKQAKGQWLKPTFEKQPVWSAKSQTYFQGQNILGTREVQKIYYQLWRRRWHQFFHHQILTARTNQLAFFFTNHHPQVLQKQNFHQNSKIQLILCFQSHQCLFLWWTYFLSGTL